MTGRQFRTYASNCFMLVIPVLLWNVLFLTSLPQGYSREFWPLFMPLTIKTGRQKFGVAVYLAGLVIYFASWMTTHAYIVYARL